MAAAFAALVSLMNNIDLILNHPRHSFSFENDQILSLRKSTLHLIHFMDQHDNFQCRCCHKETAEALEKRIVRAAHAAEDVIESHVVDQIRAGSTLRGKRASRFLLDLQKVDQDMDFVWRKVAQRGFKVTHSAAPTSSTPLISQQNCRRMVGFDGVLLQLMDILTGGTSSRRVVPIVGMGGIGKTTLATSVFQNSLIVHYFDVCLWTSISQQYSVERILSELVSCLRKSTRTRRTVDELGEVLYKSLFGIRYLIVLDDMWSVKVWDEIKFFFPDVSNGSRVVVTSRHSYVALDLSSSYFEMSFLNEDDSWDLFCQNAFAEQVCPPELEVIGKKIVEKCKGLPLSIIVVGGHLRNSSRTLEYWENVAKHMSRILNSAENERCLNIISLSYNNLPIFLKPCFLYMGAFPEDGRILVSDILQIWIAEGLVEPCGCHTLEDTAGKYLMNFIERNLIVVSGRSRFNGKVLECKMHDLVRELCLKISMEKEFFAVIDTPGPCAINRQRRVVSNENFPPQTVDAPGSGLLVRSLICEGGRMPLEMKLLRVVNKVDRALANEVNFQQLNLRYINAVLDYKSYRTLYLPSSISLLWNLQTLKITGGYLSIHAPYEFWEMLQLRHIEVDRICLLDPLPLDSSDHADDSVLEELQVLSKVENFSLSEEVCRRIPHLNELEVSYCHLEMELDEARSYYCPHNLVCFHYLDSLVCQFDDDPKWRDFALSLTFPSMLRTLSLTGSRLEWEVLTMMVGSLPHLKNLVLLSNSAIGSEWNPAEGGFPRLKSLSIHDCDDLVDWNADKSHFPALEYLNLSHLSKLVELPSGIGETLERINVEYCSMSSTISAMRMLVEQEEELGNEGIHLHVCVRGDDETLESFNEMVEEEGLRSKNICVSLQNVKASK